jgi:hypothetical protein
LMEFWRSAVIALFRAALRASLLRTEITADQMEDLLTYLEKRWWNINIQSFRDKCRSLRKTAPHRATSNHLDRKTNRYVLVQRERNALQG